MSRLNTIPRWRGFNLLDFFNLTSTGDVSEDDFRWIADWGFDFVRLPSCYTLWIENDDVYRINEAMLAKIDRAVGFGEKYHIHVSMNFHRAPGYCVNPGRIEPFNLWKDQAALDAFLFHWEIFARRYQGVPSSRLSFDLLNEPPAPTEDGMTRADHERVMRAAVAAIKAIDPERLIILDGLAWGNDPCFELADLPVAQSCRAYLPMGISHYQAPWVGGEHFPPPSWPTLGDDRWDYTRLQEHYRQWANLAAQGVGVHCGEGGAFNHTPHDILLRWFHDVLEVLKGYNIGWALWNFRGAFGILDSNRKDVAFEEWHGHKLDRAYLELLRKF